MKKDLIVYKSNALVEASYRLTPAEQGILLGCIAQIKNNEVITDETMYRIAVVDYAKITGTNLKTAYRDIKEAVIRLWRREVRLTSKPNGEGKNEPVLVTRWIQSVTYSDRNGEVALRFGRDILPYISKISKCFTKYALENVAKMSSGFGIRLYEMLSQWKGARERTVSVEWLRQALLVSEKYKTIKDFKRRVLVPAILDINKHSDLWVKWEQRKTGRKVTHLRFMFGLKKEAPETKSSGEKVLGINKATIEKNARPGETYEQAASRLRTKNKESVA